MSWGHGVLLGLAPTSPGLLYCLLTFLLPTPGGVVGFHLEDIGVLWLTLQLLGGHVLGIPTR